MLLTDDRPPTWSKVKSDGSRFVTFDSGLTPVQLQTLDKIVENIELSYSNQNQIVAENSNNNTNSNNNNKIGIQTSNNLLSASSEINSIPVSSSYIYMKHKDLPG